MEASNSGENVVKPGMHQFADPNAFETLNKHQESKISDNLERGKKWTVHKEDYEALYKRMDNLCDQTQYQAMIPIAGSDNWFADRSVKQARAICKRRMDKCDSMLKDLETEKNLFQNWRKETMNLQNSTEDGATEIREPYDEAEELKWKEEHRHKVREHKLNKKNNDTDENDEDAEHWRRLDELEIQEELEANDVSESEEESEDFSHSPPLSDDSESNEIVVQDPSFKPPPMQRRVSFGGVTQVDIGDSTQPIASLLTTNTDFINFSHTPCQSQNQNSNELDPGHLKEIFDKPNTKSILKPFEASSIPIAPEGHELPEPSDFKSVREPFIDPVLDKIVEKDNYQDSIKDVSSEVAQSSERKVSRFKLSRLA
ncbi:uncharacterized protein uri isoform X2 [Lepeophtheirus salmonis]|uniref:uncharacterized protein uri isoform X2 n=1 Tax=Lepeophtheirus salmonis TaxID=72036 RepID=UPI001AE650DC|nr:uncharacterized protein LOC121119723 [Lepeophtheirus salmonis]